jgi:DNA-directed RNA polymerase I subunit RPA2
MVKSAACYLRGLSRAELVKAKEESTEFGGYFVCNGIERIIRTIVQQVGLVGCFGWDGLP